MGSNYTQRREKNELTIIVKTQWRNNCSVVRILRLSTAQMCLVNIKQIHIWRSNFFAISNFHWFTLINYMCNSIINEIRYFSCGILFDILYVVLVHSPIHIDITWHYSLFTVYPNKQFPWTPFLLSNLTDWLYCTHTISELRVCQRIPEPNLIIFFSSNLI